MGTVILSIHIMQNVLICVLCLFSLEGGRPVENENPCGTHLPETQREKEFGKRFEESWKSAHSEDWGSEWQ